MWNNGHWPIILIAVEQMVFISENNRSIRRAFDDIHFLEVFGSTKFRFQFCCVPAARLSLNRESRTSSYSKNAVKKTQLIRESLYLEGEIEKSEFEYYEKSILRQI